MSRILARPNDNADDSGSLRLLSGWMKARQTFSAAYIGSGCCQRELLEVSCRYCSIPSAQFSGDATESFSDRLGSRTSARAQRILNFEIRKRDEFGNPLRRYISFGASTITVLARTNSLTNLRRQAL